MLCLELVICPEGPKPTDFPSSTSNLTSVQSYHSKNNYATTVISTYLNFVKAHYITQLWPGGTPSQPQNKPQTNGFYFVHLQHDYCAVVSQ